MRIGLLLLEAENLSYYTYKEMNDQPHNCISHKEWHSQPCPECATEVQGKVWVILDAHEEPTALDEMRAGSCNRVACPACGHAFVLQTPLLFHDVASHCVVAVLPLRLEPYQWRDQVHLLSRQLQQSLLQCAGRGEYDAHHPAPAYLDDIHITQDVAGVARIVAKRQHHKGEVHGEEPNQEETQEAPPPNNAPIHNEPIHAAPTAEDWLTMVQAVVQADTPTELQVILTQRYPVLLQPESDEILAELATLAVEQREYEVATVMARARRVLQEAREGSLSHPSPSTPPAMPSPGPDTHLYPTLPLHPTNYPAYPAASNPDSHTSHNNHTNQNDHSNHHSINLPPNVFQRLMRTNTSEELTRVIAETPLLQEPWATAVLSRYLDELVEQGDERGAFLLERRYTYLAELVLPQGKGNHRLASKQ